MSIQKIHEEPKTLQEDPQDYVQITINGQTYHCSSLQDWALIPNYSSWDFAACPRQGNSAFVGIRVEPFLDAEGKPLTQITQEWLDPQVKRLQLEGARYEGATPALNEPCDRIRLDWIRHEEPRSWKCAYELRVVGDKIWIFACEAESAYFDDTRKIFSILEGTFSHRTNASESSQPLASTSP